LYRQPILLSIDSQETVADNSEKDRSASVFDNKDGDTVKSNFDYSENNEIYRDFDLLSYIVDKAVNLS